MEEKNKIKYGDTVIFNSIIKGSFGEIIKKEKCKRTINSYSSLDAINTLLKNNEIEILEII